VCVCVLRNLVKMVLGKGKGGPAILTEHHVIKAYWGSGCIAPLILLPRL
jgi:hypothetical protein